MSIINKAIIMAAGFGSRMVPITLRTPKPLVKVNGKPMIETVIDALHDNNIFDIYVVVGYLKEQFSYLEKKFNGLTLIYNPYFDKCNNISSLYVARNYIDNTIILDGDQIIYNNKILNNKVNNSGYSSMYTSSSTHEWIQKVNNGRVIECQKGSENGGWQLYSISRWTHNDGLKLKKLLELEFEINNNHQIYWDDIPMFLHLKEFDLQIYEINKGDIIEVDSLDELMNIDESYR